MIHNVIDFMVILLLSVYPFPSQSVSWLQRLTKLYHATDSYPTAPGCIIGSARSPSIRIMSCKAPHPHTEHVYSASYCKLSFLFIHVKKSRFSEITEFGVSWNWDLLEQEQADRCLYQQSMLVLQDGVT